MKKLFTTTLLIFALVSCGPKEIVRHGVTLSPENVEAISKMHPDEVRFIDEKFDTINGTTRVPEVFALFGSPAEIVLEDGGMKYIYFLTVAGQKNGIGIYFDAKQNVMAVKVDGGDRFVYMQELRELTEQEKFVIENADRRSAIE